MKKNKEFPKIAIIGAGPSGMACAHTLSQNGIKTVIIEKESAVGGLCRTVDFQGYLFDIGGHRFLSSLPEINNLWHSIIGYDMLKVKRLSRIYYRKRYFNYPLSFLNTFYNLGMLESFLCIASYAKNRIFKPGDESTFEGWIINHFGKKLYNIFFKTYTEKIWSVAPKNISSDWAKERIRGLSLRVALKKALRIPQKEAQKTLYEKFLYPRRGPGQFYEKFRAISSEMGAEYMLRKKVIGIRHKEGRVETLMLRDPEQDKTEEIKTEHLFSSMPVTVFIESLIPKPPGHVLEAARRLKFRSILIVNIILDKKDIFPDQWLYIHSPQVRVGRIQNYKNWSKSMVRDVNKTSLGLEYFCSEGDELWLMDDVDIIEYALGELKKIGIASRKHLINGFVIRYPKAYPVYSLDYKNNLSVINSYLEPFLNLQVIGRNGLFRYDNSDLALSSGICAARKFLEKNTAKILDF